MFKHIFSFIQHLGQIAKLYTEKQKNLLKMACFHVFYNIPSLLKICFPFQCVVTCASG